MALGWVVVCPVPANEKTAGGSLEDPIMLYRRPREETVPLPALDAALRGDARCHLDAR